jgi:SAM-dependent methyltransferase
MNRAPNFDRLARVYRWLELCTFWRGLWRCRCHYLDELGACRTALVLGDGDGRFTARLLEANREIRIDAVDASPAMLRALLRRAGSESARVKIHFADLRIWEPGPAQYDLIVSHFFLDCLTTDEVAALGNRLRTCSSARTRWLISEFATPPGRFGKAVARPLVSVLYRAFGALTGLRVRRLPDYAQALVSAGFRRENRQAFLHGLLVTELWSAGSDRLLQSC